MQFQVRKFYNCVKNERNYIYLKCAPNISLREHKENETKVPEEYCWAITHAPVRSRCVRSGSSDLEFSWGKKSVIAIRYETY